MKKKFKLGFGIIVVALVAIAISVYLLAAQNAKNEDCSEDEGVCSVDLGSPQVKLDSPNVYEKVSENIYENDKYDFSLELDPALSDARVENIQKDDAEQVIEFIFDKGLPPLDIYIYKTSVWSGMDKSDLIEIKRDDDYVYAYKKWDAPQDSSLITEKAIANTIDTFKLNNDLNNEEEGA